MVNPTVGPVLFVLYMLSSVIERYMNLKFELFLIIFWVWSRPGLGHQPEMSVFNGLGMSQQSTTFKLCQFSIISIIIIMDFGKTYSNYNMKLLLLVLYSIRVAFVIQVEINHIQKLMVMMHS